MFSSKSRTLLFFLGELADDENILHGFFSDFLIERESEVSENTLLKYENTFRVFHFLNLEDFERRDFIAFATARAPSDWQRSTLFLNLQNLCTFSAWLCQKKLTTRKFRMSKQSYRLKRREFPDFAELELILSTLRRKYLDNHTKHRKKWHQIYLITRILFETGARIFALALIFEN